jgi:G3E family GTPase
MELVDHDRADASAPIPVTILTGFLGAGKTTLLNRILNGSHGLKVAVLVNDFGSINIDADLVVGIDTNVVSLANGCICCSIRDDLLTTVMETIDRPEKPEYILLEASGVAEPSGIAMTFRNPALRDRIRLDTILCVVDGEQVFAAPDMMELKIVQMAYADMIVLNKVDLIGRDEVGRIKEWLDSRFHRYRLVEASHCDVPLEVLLSVGRFDPAQTASDAGELHCHDCGAAGHDHDHHDHSAVFGAWSYVSDRPLSLERLREAASRLPTNIYRAKGVIFAADVPERRVVLQVVGRRVDLSVEDAWDARQPLNRIVAIGARGAIDQATLDRAFAQCEIAPGAS